MFSKNTYLLQQGSPSPHLNDNEILPYHHHDMLSGHYLGANAPVNVDAAAFFDQDVAGLNGDPSAIVDTCPTTAKKDRHSKIYTAQGPRDRRVRLSIGVARKFFDLQEMLGFDKPSKTLDWLLTKSKTAIKDLVQMTEKASTTAGVKTVSSDPSECEADSAEPFEIGKSFGTDSNRKLVTMNADKHKGEKDSKKVLNLAKELRVKARARARERTREKMCIKQLNIETRNNGYDLNPSIPTQYMNNQLEVSKISGSSSNNSSSMKANAGIREALLHCHPTYEAANEDLIQESIVIKRKVNHPSILGFQHNLIISGDLSSNYGVLPPYNAPNHWDINSFTSQSNICAIFEQHKFINSTANNWERTYF